jgi:hypothetical protein
MRDILCKLRRKWEGLWRQGGLLNCGREWIGRKLKLGKYSRTSVNEQAESSFSVEAHKIYEYVTLNRKGKW